MIDADGEQMEVMAKNTLQTAVASSYFASI
jgi:hypothetical protein